MMGGIRAMQAMEALAEMERERIKGLEAQLQGQEKIEYEMLKEEATRKNKKTWRKARAAGSIGLVTIAASIIPLIYGISEKIETKTNQQTQYSFNEYVKVRSHYFDYAWLGIITGNVICAASYITGQHIMGKRAKPVREYLKKHTDD